MEVPRSSSDNYQPKLNNSFVNYYQYISIGGWCGTRMALDKLGITNEPHNIFDHVRLLLC
jgi:hypothetical protein